MPAKRGKGIKDLLKKGARLAYNAAKSAKLLSRGLNAAGYSTAGKVAEAVGFGKKKRRSRRKRGKGPIMGSIGGIIGGMLPGWGRSSAGRGYVTNENAKVLIM